jgi:putative hydrolase of the HAD superfamily
MEDLDALGAGGFAEIVVSSVDLGYRKPHHRVFEAALEGLDAHPARTLVVGNSEENDITPARRFAMGSVRVAIEEPPPESTEADFVASSLAEVTSYVTGLASGEGH